MDTVQQKSVSGEGGEVDEDRNSVVHHYARGDVSELDQMVLMDLALVNGKNVAGDTPLHLAAKSGRVDICQTLLEHGANPLERNNKNRTPRSQIKALPQFHNSPPMNDLQISSDVKDLLLDAEEAFKEKKRDRDAQLWDEKMQKTQTESAFGLQVV